jgi:hypothetical protein
MHIFPGGPDRSSPPSGLAAYGSMSLPVAVMVSFGAAFRARRLLRGVDKAGNDHLVQVHEQADSLA